MITGARITALTVDRRTPDNTLVDFVVGADEGEPSALDTQRLTLSDFRRRLVSALVTDEPMGPAPTRPTDTEAVQLHIGVRYLLLAPVYGYSLIELSVSRRGSEIRVLHDGVEVAYALSAFRARLRTHVREELERQQRGTNRGAIDLARVAQAEEAAGRGDQLRVVELLGAWPAPLAIFLRTPEGQLLSADTRGVIAKGLGLLGTACIELSEVHKGEEVLRLAVQYAGDGPAAAEMYTRLGTAILADHRPGEAIAPLRRAANLGAAGHVVWPNLAEALAQRGRFVAALAAIYEARAAGVEEARLAATLVRVESALGPHIAPWKSLVEAQTA
jgi:hypothetical protein